MLLQKFGKPYCLHFKRILIYSGFFLCHFTFYNIFPFHTYVLSKLLIFNGKKLSPNLIITTFLILVFFNKYALYLRRDHWQKTARLILLKVGQSILKNPIRFMAMRKKGVASHFWAHKIHVKMLIWLAQSQCYGIGRKKSWFEVVNGPSLIALKIEGALEISCKKNDSVPIPPLNF